MLCIEWIQEPELMQCLLVIHSVNQETLKGESNIDYTNKSTVISKDKQDELRIGLRGEI